MKNIVKKIINSKIEKYMRVLVHALSLEIEKIKNKEDDKGSLINTIISKTLHKFKKKNKNPSKHTQTITQQKTT
jgi:23S rRNA pseudoU1915 N3-methylase RlmH